MLLEHQLELQEQVLLLVSQALIDMEISHEEFDMIMKEKKIQKDERKSEECK